MIAINPVCMGHTAVDEKKVDLETMMEGLLSPAQDACGEPTGDVGVWMHSKPFLESSRRCANRRLAYSE
jgi:hypothetical protein